jgi:Domain of unknown function (DUF4389)
VDDDRLRIRSDEPLRRRRIGVALRILLLIPHAIVLAGWGILAVCALAAAWAAASIAGQVPSRLHRFLAAYLRYSGQVTAWFHLLSGRYPSAARTLAHPFAIDVPERAGQPRLLLFLRPLVALPALLLASVFRVVLALATVAAWFTALALGRTTEGLQELGTFCLRYELEALAYLLLLTSRYPRLAPE